MLLLKNEEIEALLNWQGLVDYVEKALAEVSTSKTGPARTIISVPPSFRFYCMPAVSNTAEIAACKLITQCADNQTKFNLPSISGVLVLFNSENGQLEGILEAEILTEWRTAAGSIVAAKHLWGCTREKCKDKVLAVLGAGKQGEAHIKAFQNLFKFKAIHLWNRTPENATKLANKLKNLGIEVSVFADAIRNVKDADVVIWAASATKEILLEPENLKPEALVVSVGTSADMPSGISAKIFQQSELFTESAVSAHSEMREFIRVNNLEFSELGSVISGVTVLQGKKRVLYQSLGCGLMDAAAGRFVLDRYKSKSN